MSTRTIASFQSLASLSWYLDGVKTAVGGMTNVSQATRSRVHGGEDIGSGIPKYVFDVEHKAEEIRHPYDAAIGRVQTIDMQTCPFVSFCRTYVEVAGLHSTGVQDLMSTVF